MVFLQSLKHVHRKERTGVRVLRHRQSGSRGKQEPSLMCPGPDSCRRKPKADSVRETRTLEERC